MKIVGFMGFKGSGKDSAAQALLNVDEEWTKLAFADSLKDTLCAIFGWERNLLEGLTDDSRAWRETVDTWWANRLGLPNFTPRFAMTTLGTDIIRRYFNDDLWILALERRIERQNTNIVITDCRYHNEAALIRRLGGKLLYISKGTEPDFYKYSRIMASSPGYSEAQIILETKYKHIHSSEWAWNNIPVNATIKNDGSITDLHAQVYKALSL